jgi:acyl carrier protein
MPAIFRDSLTRFSNVCNGCFKAIYTLGINRAYALGIPVVVTGLTRGQLFETRLTPDLFENGRRSPEEVDAAVLEARKTYHRLDDQVARSLDAKIFRDDRVFEEVQVVDFYRYCDADLTEILSYLDRKAPWIRPSDTGRSTNCLINDVGIYIHQKERGFHNYGLPSSWDVRMGHKTRTQAVEELQDRLDMPRVRRILAEIGYDENRLVGTRDGIRLDAYYVSSRDVSDSELRSHVSRVLPPQLVPRSFTPLQALPLTNHGKIDEAALHSASRSVALSSGRNDTAPEGPVEERIAAIWCDVLGVDHVGRHASLFELGGTSLGAMDIVLRVCEAFDIDLPLRTVFKHATVEQLAKQVEALIVAEVAEMSEEIAERLAGGSSEDR